jgi:hypothetical protein
MKGKRVIQRVHIFEIKFSKMLMSVNKLDSGCNCEILVISVTLNLMQIFYCKSHEGEVTRKMMSTLHTSIQLRIIVNHSSIDKSRIVNKKRTIHITE